MEIDNRLLVNFYIDYHIFYISVRYSDTRLVLTDVNLDLSILPIGACYQNIGLIQVFDEKGYISSQFYRNEESVDQYGFCNEQFYSDFPTNAIASYNVKQEIKFREDNAVLEAIQDVINQT